ncbi:MAG: DUF438 domain-containing protein [Alphaproteobacteria bacterium]|uniref:DUF438 domain-containing protein n=1 Tax=Candidatus Nitrobium versatile TaxID=2884831 RepID=A0A953JEV6_9BACT|nr:DUF438 domain-containing protein [Candidatus Nitrobium versatile]
MELSAKTKIDELLKTYPFLQDFLVHRSPQFKLLQSSFMRKTVGKVATLSQVATVGGIDMNRLLSEIAEEIRSKTGESVTVHREISGAARDSRERQEILKGIILDLHKGEDMTVLKRRFHELIRDIDPSEIARMEQKLIEEGMPESEIKRLCDVHVEVFKESLEQAETPVVPAGHPVHTYMLENRAAEGIIDEISRILEQLCDTPDREVFEKYRESLRALVERLARINAHYLRKENQLFPVLESHGISGPSEVMWAIHDDIRTALKAALVQIDEAKIPEVYGTLKDLLRSINDMVYKEEHILFPMAMEMLTDADWARVQRGEEEIGYAWVRPEEGWKPGGVLPEREGKEVPGEIALNTGHLTPELVNLILTHLPVELSFVNENDEVVYYSQVAEKIFPRSPGVIGRKVQNCHPPKSLHMVQKILDEFRAGTKDVADFWIQMKGRFISIKYYAVREAGGKYRGTLEVVQDITDLRSLTGEKRLLDWE